MYLCKVNINNIHDKYIKTVLSDINVAKKFLSSFLPGDVLEFIDLETLQYAETDFVLQDLKEVFSDMVFTVSRKDDNEVYISIVLEHKSHPDDFTAVQLLLYVVYGYYKQYKNTGSLKLILPVVFYHGKQKWIFKSIEELIGDLPPKLKRYVPIFETVFIDLAKFSDKELNAFGDSLLTAILLLGKYIFRPDDLEKKISLIFDKLNSASNRNLIYPTIVYVLRNIDVNVILEIIENLPTPIKSDVMTAYDTWIKQGIEKGMEKGMEKGRQEELTKAVTKLYKKQFDIVQIADIMEIPIDKVKDILKGKELI